MKCLLCQKELPLPTEDAPRLFAGGRYFGACAAHFPSKYRFPVQWQAKFLEFEALAHAEAARRPSSAGQVALAQAIIESSLEKQGESRQP